MGYVSIARWRDIEDNHLYNEGDEFPHDGRELSPQRVDSLVSGKNKAGIALIRPVEEKVIETITETPEVAKRPVRRSKKTTV